jgi:hypothetical protein
VIGEVALDAPRSVPDYLEQAVEFCNDTLWGTLSATIIVHPKSLKDPEVAAAVERAIDDLRYGSVVVNHWSAVPYGMCRPLGRLPGAHELDDIQSGRGVVHNTYLLEDVEKSVVRGSVPPPLTPAVVPHPPAAVYAVVATGGKQYRVQPGQELTVEKLVGEVGASS